MTFPSRHISVPINRKMDEVYNFVVNPANLPQWAAGLSGSIRKEGEDWVADSPMGIVKVKFADKNLLGILDHYVTLPNGIVVYNPLRVFPNGNGSEVVFSLFQLDGMTDQQFAEDAKLVDADLNTLKSIMEKLT